ncbi:nuclear transport factor 2 family protein [Microbacterium sp. LMI12-1-1.1]|uniref:nuclear transport factor 2 family protein n=1 Tax=Microbacterium sp. LMI12-1-1.1 TaxID=3135225 RepID=UPI003431B607
MTTLSAHDQGEIRDLLIRYAYAIDFNDPAVLVSCFAANAVVEVLGLPTEAGHAAKGEGHEQLVQMLAQGFAGNQGHSRHWVLPVLIERDGDGARAVTYLTVIRPGEFPNTGVLLTGVYRDRLIRTGDGWRIVHRTFHADPQPEHQSTTPTDVLVERFGQTNSHDDY